mgnify:CR=1 FL=1
MKLPDLSSAISQTHIALQSNAIKAINRNLTLRNWLIGFYIVEKKKKGEMWGTGVVVVPRWCPGLQPSLMTCT